MEIQFTGTTKARTVNSKFVTPTRPSPEEEKAMDVDMPSGPRGSIKIVAKFPLKMSRQPENQWQTIK
jgi:hypothetical protein